MAHSEDLKATAMTLWDAHRPQLRSDNAAATVVADLLERQGYKVSEGSVRAWAKRKNINCDIVEKYEGKKLSLAALFEDSMRRVFDLGMSDEKIKQASFRDLSVFLGIAAEKHQLLTGQPTSIEGQRGSLWDHINSVSKNDNSKNGKHEPTSG